MHTLEVKSEDDVEPGKHEKQVDQFERETGLIRRGFMRKLFWFGVLAVVGIKMCDPSDEKQRQSDQAALSERFPERLLNGTQKEDPQESVEETEPKTYFDNLPQKSEIIERQRAPGVRIREDHGICFYKVLPGENLEKIRAKLSKLKDFAYLEHQKRQDQSFNFPDPKSLPAKAWIPVPLSNKDRIIPRRALKRYCEEAIDDLLVNDGPYAAKTKQALASISDKNALLAFMMAIAKQESGTPDGQVGTLEFHRWEKHHDCFSLSMYHVMMCYKGNPDCAGNRARKKLGKTYGQLYHPHTGAELFFGFIFERLRDEGGTLANRFFPFEEKVNAFAEFYNGESYNPAYPTQLIGYYREALKFLAQQPRRKFAFNQK